jgi:hypothetical protein
MNPIFIQTVFLGAVVDMRLVRPSKKNLPMKSGKNKQTYSGRKHQTKIKIQH